MQKRRKVIYVGEQIQRVLAWRSVMQWIACLGVVYLSVFVTQFVETPGEPLGTLWMQTASLMGGPLLLAASCLPWIVISSLRMSVRFSGPMQRIRRSLQHLQAGRRIEPLQVRKADFYQDVAQEINALARAFGRLESNTQVDGLPSPPRKQVLGARPSQQLDGPPTRDRETAAV